jgi:hypothetical protein
VRSSRSCCRPLSLQRRPDRGPDATIDAATRSRVIQGVLQRLEEGYVFPEKTMAMLRVVRERAKRGAYDRILSAHAFADTPHPGSSESEP